MDLLNRFDAFGLCDLVDFCSVLDSFRGINEILFLFNVADEMFQKFLQGAPLSLG